MERLNLVNSLKNYFKDLKQQALLKTFRQGNPIDQMEFTPFNKEENSEFKDFLKVEKDE